MTELYLGLISGTSADGIDVALVDLSQTTPKLIDSHCEPIPTSLKNTIVKLCTPGANEIDQLGQLDIELGKLFAVAANHLLKTNQLTASQIKAIGSHGQTIRHRPSTNSKTNGFTLQIADANTIAEMTNITTVADFRRRDMAAGGQGAPFAPAFHCAIAPKDIETCVFLNLGGIANITFIHQNELIYGFDTGPANGLMDMWIQKHLGLPYDDNGRWAKTGTASKTLLNALLSYSYFSKPAPKSTGREEFNLTWLEAILSKQTNSLPPEDIQATLLQLSSTSIASAVKHLPNQPDVIYCCGGGAHNSYLLESLTQQCDGITLATTDELGIAPDWIEACAFAWLAKQTLNKNQILLKQVTGANDNNILGGIYYTNI